jgi:uncharacterized protein YjbI with pentapeptide repeats
MTKAKLIELLQAGKVDKFNQFRAENPDFILNFSYVNLRGAILCRVNLRGVDLSYAELQGADL